MRNRWRSFGAVAVLAVVATVLVPSWLVWAAAAQTVEDIEGRDRILFDREAQLNEYRCQYNVDTQMVRGGCTDGVPAVDPVSPQPFTGTPTEAEIASRDRLISVQHALLNAYRCLFNFETEHVPGGCATGEPDGDQAAMAPDFPIEDTTTGGDMLALVSEAESACLATLMGDADFARFQGAPLVETAAMDGTYSIWADCLEFDNLLAVAVGLVSHTGGGWEQSSRECTTAVARNYPELVFYALDLTDRIAEEGFSTETQANFSEFFQCQTAEEQVAFSVVTRQRQTTGLSGQKMLEFLPASEFECLQGNMSESDFNELANTPDILTYVIGMTPAVQIQMLSCLSAETLDLIPEEILIANYGISSESGRACMFAFFDENPDFYDLAVQSEQNPESLTPEQLNALTEGSFEIVACMTHEEVQLFVENILSLLVP